MRRFSTASMELKTRLWKNFSRISSQLFSDGFKFGLLGGSFTTMILSGISNTPGLWQGDPVINNEQEAIGKTLGEFLQKHIHAQPIHGGQNKVAGGAVLRTNRAIHIGIFTDDLRRHIRAESFGRPTILRLADASEPRFILKEDLERLAYDFGFLPCFFDDLRPVFLKASCSTGSPCGCLGRGVILRQP